VTFKPLRSMMVNNYVNVFGKATLKKIPLLCDNFSQC
jgi:hypothetical protein